MAILLKHNPSKHYRVQARKERSYRFDTRHRPSVALRYERKERTWRLQFQRLVFLLLTLSATAFLIDGSIAAWHTF